MKARYLAAALLLAPTPSHAIIATYDVSGVFYPLIQNCPACSPLSLSGTLTVNQSLTNWPPPGADIMSADLVVGGLDHFTLVDDEHSYSILPNFTTVNVDSSSLSITFSIKPGLSSDVTTAAIYSGAILDQLGTIQYYSLGSSGYLKVADGTVTRSVHSVPGPVAGAGLPGLIMLLALWQRWRRCAKSC